MKVTPDDARPSEKRREASRSVGMNRKGQGRGSGPVALRGTAMPMKTVVLSVELLELEAAALAQFLKRLGYDDWMAKAQDENECNGMRAAGVALERELAAKSFNPR